MVQLSEDYLVEQSAINWLKSLGYSYISGSELSFENNERESYRQVILKQRFLKAVKRLNPWLSDQQAEEVYRKIIDLDHPDFVMKGKIFYELLTGGVKITIKDKTKIVKLIDFENLDNNEFLVANQFTVEYQYQNEMHRRPDMVIFVNGMPLAIFEFKSFNANETAKDAYYDHKTKMADIPQLYCYGQILVASDGLETKYGSPTSDWDRFFVWEGIFDDDDLAVKTIEENRCFYIVKPTNEQMTSLEVLLKGLFRKEHLCEYLQDFIFYEKSGESYQKLIAMFHQFFTTRKAIVKTQKAVLEGKTPEARRIGVVWHTQGTGKSLTMLFYARKVLKAKELENSLLLFITDRNNLDEQLYEVFAAMPIVQQAESIKELQELIKATAVGIVFATIQKFGKRRADEYPFLTDRRNIIVIADEAHRSQYRELAMNLRRAIPNASFLGFTATPIELEARSTTLVFGDYINIYSMERARRHGVVVPIYYDARLSKLHLSNEFIDEEFEEISEAAIDEPAIKESLKKKYARLEKIILSEERLEAVAKDIVEHFNQRVQELKGKAMVVTISRRVAVKLYEKIIKQPNAPSVLVVMSGNRQKDPSEYWQHLRDKRELEAITDNFKNPDTDPQMVIVVDMLLTGFDIPCLHTMYFDKPMKGHSLVQAIARVNRVFKDKPGGLIVDYIGIADDLRKSLMIYTLDTIRDILLNIEEVVNLLKEKYDIVSSLLVGIDYKDWIKLKPEDSAKITTLAYDRISREEAAKKQFIKNYVALKKLYALASPHPISYQIKNDIRFFEMIKKMIVKYAVAKVRDINRDLEYELNQLISQSISAEEPIDVFALIGKDKPDISIFDENFLAQFQNMQYRNYAAELLTKVIKDQLVARLKVNPFRYRSLYDMLNRVIDHYNIKLIDTTEVIEELIKIAKRIKKASAAGKKLNLSLEELAFYDLLVSKEKYFTDFAKIEEVAKEIVKELGYYVKVADWDKKEYTKAKIKAAVKKVLLRVTADRVSYDEIDRLSAEVINHAVVLYAA